MRIKWERYINRHLKLDLQYTPALSETLLPVNHVKTQSIFDIQAVPINAKVFAFSKIRSFLFN